jgi:hypothetical protein
MKRRFYWYKDHNNVYKYLTFFLCCFRAFLLLLIQSVQVHLSQNLKKVTYFLVNNIILLFLSENVIVNIFLTSCSVIFTAPSLRLLSISINSNLTLSFPNFEDVELANQMDALGLPVSFSSSKVRLSSIFFNVFAY